MGKIFGERGFVTIATGQERYYMLARNLLRSYRRFTDAPVPFAIIADRENEYTAEFDHAIVIPDASNSYNDKLKLFRELPFEETIFVDADSLAYGDLNAWWDIFKSTSDFSLFGYAWRDLDCGRGWFVPSGMGKFKDQITFIPDFNGGVYYIRNTDACKKVFDIANYCASHYEQYHFNGFSTPADEPVLALGMAVCGFEPINKDDELIFAPRSRQLDADISIPKAIFIKNKQVRYPVRLIHFSNYRTQLSFYRSEVAKLTRSADDSDKHMEPIIDAARAIGCRLYDVIPFSKRVLRKVKRIIHKC